MNRKACVLRPPIAKTREKVSDRCWHNGGDIEIYLYARSLHRAAKILVETLSLKRDLKTAWDACPVLLLYRQSIELHLKCLVSEGSNFLPSPTDPISLYKTHSLRWLAQLVSQIVKALRWEDIFKCEGVASLAEFTALVNEIEALEPVSCAVHSISPERDGSVPSQFEPHTVVRLTKKLDALLKVLDATADSLAAAWDQRDTLEGGDFTPTIQ
jgi:hypothetical protein